MDNPSLSKKLTFQGVGWGSDYAYFSVLEQLATALPNGTMTKVANREAVKKTLVEAMSALEEQYKKKQACIRDQCSDR